MTTIFQTLGFTCAATLILSLGAVTSADESDATLLHWKNGDVVSGRLVGAENDAVFWHTNLFKGDLEIDISVLKRLVQPVDTSRRTTEETYFVRTKTGDKIYGLLEKIDAEYAYLTSKRHKQVKIKTASIAQIAHMKNAGFVLLGPTDLSRWGSLKNSRKHWEISDSGQLQTHKRNANISFATELPDAVQIELELKWDKRLNFIFGLGVPGTTGAIEKLPRLESWEDSIVLTHEDDFEILYEEIDSKAKSLKLHLVWDRVKNRVIVNDESGQQLCDAQIPDLASSIKTGIYLQNKHENLIVETLRIGKVASGFDPNEVGVHRLSGTFEQGRVKSFDGESFVLAQDDGEVEVPVSDFREAVLVPPQQFETPPANVLVRFQDGALIRGKFHSLDSDRFLLIESHFADELLPCRLDDVVSIRFDTEGDVLESGKQVLFLEGGQIQGEVVGGSGKLGDVLRWRPVGSRSSLPLGPGDKRIAFKPVDDVVEISTWPDTIYFANRDMLPCRIETITPDAILFESFTENRSVAAETVKAIDFSPLRAKFPVRCDDANWYFSKAAKDDIVVKADKMVSGGKGHFAHPLLASARRLSFKISWKPGSYSQLTCKLLLRDLEKQSGGVPISMFIYDSSVSVSGAVGNNWNRGGAQIQVRKNEAEIVILHEQNEITVYVAGNKAYSVKPPSHLIKGRGVSFACSPYAGLPTTNLTLSDFVIDNENAGTTSAVVDLDKKTRFFDDPPNAKRQSERAYCMCAKR